MTIYRLPPAGDSVVVVDDRTATRQLLQSWLPYKAAFYASGTAALAAAVAAALALRPGRNEVVLPAYACPALISAVLYAGGRPVLADLEPNRPWMARSELATRVGAETAAVIAVNFLGIPERLAAVAACSAAAGALLIEDSAQAYPPAGLVAGRADFSVLSLGRGKPVSLLSGGVVLASDDALVAALPVPRPIEGSRWRICLKAAAYNCLRKPQLYWVAESLPLGLGKTRYQPLRRIDALDRVRQRALGGAVRHYQSTGGSIQHALRSGLKAAANGALLDLADVCAPEARLLRYPLLAAKPELRGRLVRVLGRAGLGGSGLYGSALPAVEGIPAELRRHRLPNAADFAGRLLTLPVHEGVTSAHVERMCAEIGVSLRTEGEMMDYQVEKHG